MSIAAIIKAKSISYSLLAMSIVGCGVWLFLAASSVTVTDARVVADVVAVRSQVDGTITKVHVQDGQVCPAGSLLVEIDDRLSRSAVAESEAKLDRLKSSWQQLAVVSQRTASASKLTSTGAILELEAADLSVQAAKVRESQSQSIFDRSSQLASKGLLAKASVDLDRDALDLAQLDAGLAKTARTRRMNALRSSRLGADDAVAASLAADAAKHAVAEAEAALSVARVVQSYHEVRSVGPGVIGKLLVRDGESVIEGQRLVLKYDSATIRIEARVSERDLRNFKVGKKVTVSLDAAGGEKVQGVVTTIGALTQTATSDWPQQPEQGNFIRVAQKVPVQIALIESRSGLIPGTLAKVSSERE